MPRAPGDVAGGMACGMPDMYTIMGLFDDSLMSEYLKWTQSEPEDLSAPLKTDLEYMVALTNYHQHIIHINNTTQVRQERLAPPDNHDLRVQFLMGELDEVNVSSILQKRDKTYRKTNAKRQIYDTVYQTATDIYRVCVDAVRKANGATARQNAYHASYVELGALLKYANGCLERVEKAYMCLTIKYALNPFRR
jgi:hypothetical protein